MARNFSKKFYNSKNWKKTRLNYTAYRFGICERCGAPNSRQVHHKEYLTPLNINNPDVTLNYDNLELLCDDCHAKEHHEKHSPTEWGLYFNDKGDLIKGQNYDRQRGK